MRTFNKPRKNAFTLIELLAVIAVIAILGSILIPVASGVIRQARIASYKATLWQYITAIEQFKEEYNYYPQVFDNSGLLDLSGTLNSQNLVEALSGRAYNTGNTKDVGGNYRMIQFYTFSEKEFFDTGGENYSPNRLSDPFNNTNIFIMIDVDGNGIISPVSSNPDSPGAIKGTATAWVVGNGNNPGYALWE